MTRHAPLVLSCLAAAGLFFSTIIGGNAQVSNIPYSEPTSTQTTSTITPSQEVDVTLQAEPPIAKVGDTITHTLTITNGSQTFGFLTILVDIPPSTALDVSRYSLGGNYCGRTSLAHNPTAGQFGVELKRVCPGDTLVLTTYSRVLSRPSRGSISPQFCVYAEHQLMSCGHGDQTGVQGVDLYLPMISK